MNLAAIVFSNRQIETITIVYLVIIAALVTAPITMLIFAHWCIERGHRWRDRRERTAAMRSRGDTGTEREKIGELLLLGHDDLV